MSPTRLLAVGDLHLGRRPHRLAPFVSDLDRYTPAVALHRVVRRAVETRADAVLFAGDLVDRDEDLFEAYGALEQAARRLVEANVRVLAVAGNHDARVLPRLLAHVKEVELLGAGGRWGSTRVGHAGLVGWSFPGSHHKASPLDSPGFDEAVAEVSDRPATLGLLHADLDASGGAYAPVRRDDLRRTGLAAWLVGHVHQPDLWAGVGHVGYLGSLVGLDRGEAGTRGVWEIEVSSQGRLQATHRPVGPVLWMEHRVTLAPDATDVDAMRDAALQALNEVDATVEDPDGVCDAVAVTLRVEGEVDHPEQAATALGKLNEARGTLGIPRGRRTLAIVRILAEVRPRVVLEDLRALRDARGLVAGLLDDLRKGRPLPDELTRRLEQAADDVLKGGLSKLDDDADGARSRDQAIENAAWRLLADLSRQAANHGAS